MHKIFLLAFSVSCSLSHTIPSGLWHITHTLPFLVSSLIHLQSDWFLFNHEDTFDFLVAILGLDLGHRPRSREET
jgi:hypothetical protein